jgi:uncharacterized protein HemX
MVESNQLYPAKALVKRNGSGKGRVLYLLIVAVCLAATIGLWLFGFLIGGKPFE